MRILVKISKICFNKIYLPGFMLVVTSAPTGFTVPVSASHPKCPRKCLSKYIAAFFMKYVLKLNFSYVCEECKSAKESEAIYCLCRQPYDDSQ